MKISRTIMPLSIALASVSVALLLSGQRATAMGIVHCAGANASMSGVGPQRSAGIGTFDPIVNRGSPMSMHEHQFFGFTEWKAMAAPWNANHDDLVGKLTSCNIPQDSAAYWSPTLRFTGGSKYLVPLMRMEAYYRSWDGKLTDANKSTLPFPNDLRMVAGNPMAMSPMDMDISKVAWSCGNLSSKSERAGFRYRSPVDADCSTAYPIRAGGKVVLTVSVKFPTCWDGQLNNHTVAGNTTDFSGDKMPMTTQHLQYTVRGACPAGFPHKLPQLTFVTSWDYRGNGKNVALSSGMGEAMGQGYTFHADFLNAWQPLALKSMVDTCINTDQLDSFVHQNNADICGPPVIMQP